MHRGFNLQLESGNSYYETGKALYEADKVNMKRSLSSFINPNGSLNAAKMQADWFPQIDRDIFISHSHDDERIAISLAGWINANLGLSCFIDSCIWENAHDLLQIIDKKYIYNENSHTYDYDQRNRSTSHVHMMLSTALSMMIDKTECLFFLNTNKSIVSSGVRSVTHSPWIYFEIATSQYIRKRPVYRRKETESFTKAMSDVNESKLPNFEYQLYLGHLTDLTGNELVKWRDTCTNQIPRRKDHPLDVLYESKPLPKPKYLHG